MVFHSYLLYYFYHILFIPLHLYHNPFALIQRVSLPDALYPIVFTKTIEKIKINIPSIIEIYKLNNRLNKYYYIYLYYDRYFPYKFTILFNIPYEIIEDAFFLTPIILYLIKFIIKNKQMNYFLKHVGLKN